MAKLSDIFLHVLGNALQGDQGTPAGQEERNRLNSASAASNLTALANIGQAYDTKSVPAGPMEQGAIRPPADSLASLGMDPNSVLTPIPHSATVAIPNLKTGTLSTQTVPVPRGGTFQEANPFSAMMLGQQKNYLDQATALENSATADMNQVTALVGKMDPGVSGAILTSLAQNTLPANISNLLKDPALENQIRSLTGQMLQKRNMANQLRTQGMGVFGAPAPGGPAAPAGSAIHAPPPQNLFTNVPAGHIPVYNRATSQYGWIPQANFNPMLHEQVANPAAAAPAMAAHG